jgi:tRNA A-37 threonylcarbamoyl transferase component Bud32
MPAFLEAGTEVAGYRVTSFIGRGGMAVVYKAEDLRLGRNVALKLLAPELSQNERFQQRFMRESRLAASIDHPNIIPIYEAGETGGLLYIVMRYVDGSDLKAVIEREGPLSPERLVQLLRQVGGALDAAHARGLVHRDVKPGNILIASGAGTEHEDHVYLTDFGLTKRSSSLSGLTATGHFLGTIDYVAPEQITGNPVDARTDIYALGCVLYESATGTVPYERDDDAALLWAHLVEAPPSIRERRPELPDGLDTVISTAMAKAPDERYSSCRELAVAVQALLGVAGGSSAGGSSSAGPVADAPPKAPPGPVEPAESAESAEPVGLDGRQEPGSGSIDWGPPTVQQAPEPEAGSEAEAEAEAEAGQPAQAWEEPALAEAGAASTRSRPPRPQRAPGRRGRLVALLAVAAVLLAAIPAVFLVNSFRNPDRLTETSARDNLVPFSFKYPGTWRRNAAGINVVFSPAGRELTTLFSQKGTGDSWKPVNELLKNDPDKAVGLAASFTSTVVEAGSAEQLKEALQPLLPVNATFSAGPDQLLVGGYAADKLEGDLTDPADPGARLHFMAIVVQVQRPEPKTVYLVFFAPQDRFDGKRDLFGQMQDTVDFLS